jgi:hypothetical protein
MNIYIANAHQTLHRGSTAEVSSLFPLADGSIPYLAGSIIDVSVISHDSLSVSLSLWGDTIELSRRVYELAHRNAKRLRYMFKMQCRYLYVSCHPSILQILQEIFWGLLRVNAPLACANSGLFCAPSFHAL